MPWTYAQKSGRLLSPQGIVITIGYSGAIGYKNLPEFQSYKDRGPIPAGWYTMEEPRDTEEHGPYAIPLLPDAENEMFDRSEFMCHGDSVTEPGTASKGCLILAKFARERAWESGDHRLLVMPELPGIF